MVIIKRYHPETTLQALVTEKITFFPAGPQFLTYSGLRRVSEGDFRTYAAAFPAQLSRGRDLKNLKIVTG